MKAHIAIYNRLTKDRNSIQINDLVIHSESRQVLVNGDEKIFTAKEFDLLYFLATNRNIVFSKEQLFERI